METAMEEVGTAEVAAPTALVVTTVSEAAAMVALVREVATVALQVMGALRADRRAMAASKGAVEGSTVREVVRAMAVEVAAGLMPGAQLERSRLGHSRPREAILVVPRAYLRSQRGRSQCDDGLCRR